MDGPEFTGAINSRCFKRNELPEDLVEPLCFLLRMRVISSQDRLLWLMVDRYYIKNG